jgi:hypothetical protein
MKNRLLLPWTCSRAGELDGGGGGFDWAGKGQGVWRRAGKRGRGPRRRAELRRGAAWSTKLRRRRGRAPATNSRRGRKRMAGSAVGEGELVGADVQFIEEREGERAPGGRRNDRHNSIDGIHGGFEWREREGETRGGVEVSAVRLRGHGRARSARSTRAMFWWRRGWGRRRGAAAGGTRSAGREGGGEKTLP